MRNILWDDAIGQQSFLTTRRQRGDDGLVPGGPNNGDRVGLAIDLDLGDSFDLSVVMSYT